jgi:hypothetical protein
MDQIIFRFDPINLRCTSEALLVVLKPAEEHSRVVAVVAEIEYNSTSAIIRIPSSVTTQNALMGLQGYLKCPASKDDADETLQFTISIPPSTPSLSDVFPLRMMVDSTQNLGGSLLHIRITGVHSFPETAKVGQQSVHITVGEKELLVLQARKELISPEELHLVAFIPQFFEGGHSLKVHFQDPLVRPLTNCLFSVEF